MGQQTFGGLKVAISTWLRETVEAQLLNDAANDAISALWYRIVLINMSEFLQGPITSLNITSGSERAQIITIADPLVAPNAFNIANADAHIVSLNNWAYTYVTESGSETLLSPPRQLNTTDGNMVEFSNGVPPDPELKAIGYNVYAEVSAGTKQYVKQNDLPLQFQDQFQAIVLIEDPNAPRAPKANTTADDICQVSVMEIQMQDGTWNRWEGGELAGFLFKRMASTLAFASTTQSYAWDVVNNRTIEIRPAAGMDLNPRYFYIQKPRRFKFDNASLPFNAYDAEPFLRYEAMSLVKLALEEFQSSNAWKVKSQEAALLILGTTNLQNKPRTQTVRPYLR